MLVRLPRGYPPALLSSLSTPVRFEGEIVGNWACPIYNAAHWLLESGRAGCADTVEIWRQGRGGPDYILERMPVGRAADLVVTAGKEVRDLNERRQENLTTRAGTQEDYDFLARIDLSSDEDDERVIFYKKGKAAGKLGPFELNTAADLFFYRGWRKGRGKKT